MFFSGKIKIRKTLEILGSRHAHLEVRNENQADTNLYILPEPGFIPVKVTFTCSYDASLSVATNPMLVKPRISITSGAVEAEGSLDGTLILKYYTDDTYTTELDINSEVFIG